MASKESIKEEVDSWIKSKKKLAGLLLDQTKISGIGVAWGSEILYKANLRPDLRTCDQNLMTLADSILYIREKIKNIYEKELKENNANLKDFVNEWFSNLYEIREMEVYKKGSKLEVLGRSWWV
jgi:formamidopyrimidine-DNA glycosylase